MTKQAEYTYNWPRPMVTVDAIIFDNITMKSTGALIDTEILARAVKAGYRIRQKGVHHYPRISGEQTGAKLSVIFRAFKELFALYGQIRKCKT